MQRKNKIAYIVGSTSGLKAIKTCKIALFSHFFVFAVCYRLNTDNRARWLLLLGSWYLLGATP